MADKKPSKSTITISVDQSLELETWYATQFRVAADADVVTLFLSHSVSGQTVASYALVITRPTLGFNRESTVAYYQRFTEGFPEVKAAEETAAFGALTPKVVYGSFLDLAHYGEMGQLRLNWVDIRRIALAQKAEEKNKVAGKVVCVVDMPMSVQLGIVKKLYMGL